MKMKTQHRLTKVELLKLLNAADAARERVSTYSDEKRAELEASARSKIHHARTKTVCRT
jgi:hypothetical protein